MKVILSLLIVTVGAIFFGGCGNPVDPYAVGSLCLPATEACASAVSLERTTAGRNSMELRFLNRGEEMTLELRVLTREDVELVRSRPVDEEGRTVLFEGQYGVGGGEELYEFLTSRDLTVASALELELRCVQETCDVEVSYLVMAEAVECFDDSGCRRNEICEAGLGRCASCVNDDQCGVQQVCNLDTGECFPGATGCGASASPSPVQPPFLALIALIALALVLLTLRRRSGVRRGELLTLLLVLGVFACSPREAAAEQGASLVVGVGPRAMTGEVGEHTRIGWGLAVQQQLRWRALGAAFTLSTYFVPLRPEAGPAGSEIRGYGVSVGPRWVLGMEFSRGWLGAERPLELVLGVDYTRWSVAENRLARLTGLDLAYNGFGPNGALHLRWRGLKVVAGVGYTEVLRWPGGNFSANLMVGLGI